MKKPLLTCAAFLLVIFCMRMVLAAGLKMPPYAVTGVAVGHKSCKSEVPVTLATEIPSPKPMSWKEATAFYDFSKALPAPTPDELQYDKGRFSKEHIVTRHLPAVFAALYKKSFSAPNYGLKSPADPAEDWLRSFGDLIGAFKNLRGKKAETDAALNRLQSGYPAIWAEVKDVLPALAKSDFLYSDHWEPWRDEDSPGQGNDGIYFIPYWQVKPNAKRGPSWNGDLSEHQVHQGGVVIFAPLGQIKKSERDYKLYAKHIGMGYYEAAPVANSYAVGTDDRGNEFVALEVFFCQDLPFPYDASKYTMKLLDYYNEKGLYVSDYYAERKNDVNWMAGRDTYFPLETSKGEFVGYLIATELGFDIKNLPDRDQDRVVTIKGAWGNIKLLAEGYGFLSKFGPKPGKVSR